MRRSDTAKDLSASHKMTLFHPNLIVSVLFSSLRSLFLQLLFQLIQVNGDYRLIV